MSMSRSTQLLAAATSCASLLVASTVHAEAIVLGPTVDVGASIPVEAAPADDLGNEELVSRVAVAAGPDGALVVWTDAEIVSGATLDLEGNVGAPISLDPAGLVQLNRVFGARGDGSYLFTVQGTAVGIGERQLRLFVLGDDGAVIASSTYTGICANGAPSFAAGRYYVPCAGSVLSVDPSDATVSEPTPFQGAGSADQALPAIACVAGACTMVGPATDGVDPLGTIYALRLPGAAVQLQVGFRDALHASFAAVPGANGEIVVARCLVEPCGDIDGQAKERFIAFALAPDGTSTALEPFLVGDGVRSPRLATNGRSVALAYRTLGAGPGVAGFSTAGVARDAVVPLGDAYASSLAIAAFGEGDYVVAYDEGSKVLVRTVRLDAPVSGDGGGGAGGDGAPDASEDGCGCTTAPRGSFGALGALGWLVLFVTRRRRA